jgi:tetratricopeptide (TPR) repeat protein
LAKTHPEDIALTGEKAAANPSTGPETVSHTSPVPPIEQLAADPVQGEPALTDQPSTPEVAPPEEASPEEAEPQESPAAEEIAEPTRVFRGVPTAAALTERGIALFNQRRVQESIDQFTKALALDPSYPPAWEARAEAYSQLGRQDDAAEDRRRLKAINAS